MFDYTDSVVKIPVKTLYTITENGTATKATLLYHAFEIAAQKFPNDGDIFDEFRVTMLSNFHDSKVFVANEGSDLLKHLNALTVIENAIEVTARTFIPLIRFQKDNLDEILSLDKVTTGEVERIISSNREEAPSSNTSIRKLNETPNAGANPNLLDDTYLSESERNTLETGLKEVSANDNLTEASQIVVNDNMEKARIMGEISDNIHNFYIRWRNAIDRMIFVI